MTSWPPLTVRIDGDSLRSSTDDGRTVVLDLPQHSPIRHAIDRLRRHVSAMQAGSQHDSVVAWASVAEAAQLRPATDDPPPPHGLAGAVVDGPRIALGSRAESAPTMPLRDVLARRRSRRHLGSISLDEVGPLLVRAGRTRTLANVTGRPYYESRPFPSAGARHPIEFVLAARGVPGLDDGWWWFEPFRCELAPVVVQPEPEGALAKLADVAAIRQPLTAAVFAVASFDRTLSRYPAGSTLVWRDAGAALATVHLVATELGLASCIVGTSSIIRPSAEGDGLVTDVGAVAVGSWGDPES